ncbi:MAG TPA: hypothetical protein DHW39_06285 [Erysipelotrichaceae bacterium]|nr:hypothetical protein [Erysipelotrichaceae bacterium]
MSKLECHVVQDLLPMYADGLVSEKTGKDIEEHLAGCRECSEMLREMKLETEIEKSAEMKKIDYLKKVRNRTKKIVIGVTAAALLILAVPFFRYFVIGQKETSLIWKAAVNDKNLVVETMEPGSALCISKIGFKEENGVITVSAREVLPLIYHSGNKAEAYNASGEIRQVVTESGYVLYEDGISISAEAARIFKNRVKYVGNNSGVSNLLSVAGLNWRTNLTRISFTKMILQTEKQPYGLILETDLRSDADMKDYDQYGARDLACIMLAGVENLSEVTYRYTDGVERTYTLKDASEIAGSSIKEFGKSASGMQKLLNILAGTKEGKQF